MKRAVVRVLMVFGILTALGAAQAAIAGEPSPCQGVNQTLGANIKNKTDLARAITKQLNVSHPALKISSTTVLRSFASGNWSIVYVAPDKAERVFVFYAGNPLTSRYVTLWGGEGATTVKDEPIIKNWVLKNAPGIPPKLASCFAWYVTRGRDGSAQEVQVGEPLPIKQGKYVLDGFDSLNHREINVQEILGYGYVDGCYGFGLPAFVSSINIRQVRNNGNVYYIKGEGICDKTGDKLGTFQLTIAVKNKTSFSITSAKGGSKSLPVEYLLPKNKKEVSYHWVEGWGAKN